MATKKFVDPSPYTKPQSVGHDSDYLYKQYLKHLSLGDGSPLSTGVINFAIFGLGRAGTIHLSNLAQNPRAKLLYVVDDDVGRHAQLKKYWKLDDTVFLASSGASEVFKDSRVHAVVVASPTHTHEDIVHSALDSGMAVFCEKPVAENLQDSKKCYEHARRVGKPLFTAFNRRFDPAYSKLRDRVLAGEVGHVHIIKTTSRDAPLPTIAYLKESGGVYHDCSVHDIDMLCWVLGEYPTRVAVFGHANIPEIAQIDDHDTVAMIFSFPSGAVGMTDLSRNACYGYDQRLEAFGPRGVLRCDDERPMSGLSSQTGLDGATFNPIYFSFPSRFKLGYYYEMEHFLDYLQGKTTKMLVEDHEVLAVSKIATACDEAARTGRTVDITWSKDELPQ
ncbi:myo-inositol 2-dehydrogenase-like [Bacillus rossius redtenbacheri]|uniref:myo-inositol 2-dehydrogenase-like n=1 Tax=Bacillus rossius redtenbacheri TaxID=93214 RepID=UPI002FDCDFFD